MTREETKKAIEVMQAYVDGKEIEYYSEEDKWKVIQDCAWDWVKYDHRIKQEPKPFDWRGKNIQWIQFEDNHGNSYKVSSVCEFALYYRNQNIEEKLEWDYLRTHWQWSEDNQTWRKFE